MTEREIAILRSEARNRAIEDCVGTLLAMEQEYNEDGMIYADEARRKLLRMRDLTEDHARALE